MEGFDTMFIKESSKFTICNKWIEDFFGIFNMFTKIVQLSVKKIWLLRKITPISRDLL